MRKLALILALFLVPGLLFAGAISDVLPEGLKGGKLRGSATFRYLGIPVYDARLFTPGGQALDWSADFALELTYRRNLSRSDLVKSTLDELDRLGPPLDLGAKLESCLSDVGAGDRYLAVTQGPDKIRFWLNGKSRCTLSHPGITRRFMEIFLGDNTRSARFTRALRGN